MTHPKLRKVRFIRAEARTAVPPAPLISRNRFGASQRRGFGAVTPREVRCEPMLRWARAVLCLGVLSACTSADRAPPAAPRVTAERAEAPLEAPVPDHPLTDDLSWDGHVGWEPRHHFAPGEVSFQRPEGSFLVLEYSLPLGPGFATLAERSAGIALRDKPLIVRHAAELCHPALQGAVARIAPDRLLVHIDDDLDERARDCLARLDVQDLFLSLCRHDGRLPTIDHCTDGDAQLALIVSSAELRAKIRGLAIGFGEERSWQLLPQLARLSHLAIQGDALANVDVRAAFDLCNLRELHHVDMLNPKRPGNDFDVPVPQCVMRWTTFTSWTLAALRPVMRASPPPSIPCSLRRVQVWEIEPEERARLGAMCADLEELEVITSQERCRRERRGQPLACARI